MFIHRPRAKKPTTGVFPSDTQPKRSGRAAKAKASSRAKGSPIKTRRRISGVEGSPKTISAKKRRLPQSSLAAVDDDDDDDDAAAMSDMQADDDDEVDNGDDRSQPLFCEDLLNAVFYTIESGPQTPD